MGRVSARRRHPLAAPGRDLTPVVYALRRPDPWPRAFGYHEIFHALVIAAAMMNYVYVILVVRTST